jgi:hypothetical protein
VFTKHVKPKKQHEISRMAQVYIYRSVVKLFIYLIAYLLIDGFIVIKASGNEKMVVTVKLTEVTA